MSTPRAPISRIWASLEALRRDRRGSSAVEFALVCAPFIFTLLAILQMGIYFMTQSALDAGVNAEADALNATYYSQSTTASQTPTIATLQAQIAAKAGGLVQASTLLVDLQPLYNALTNPNLTTAPIPIGSNPPNIGSAGACTSTVTATSIETGTSCGSQSPLALRAQSPVISFAPGFGSLLVVRSAVLLRRQGQ